MHEVMPQANKALGCVVQHTICFKPEMSDGAHVCLVGARPHSRACYSRNSFYGIVSSSALLSLLQAEAGDACPIWCLLHCALLLEIATCDS